MRFMLAFFLVLLASSESLAGWRFSSHYRQGYSYYGACSYGGYNYCAGYWYYEPVVVATFYQPYYVPAVFSTYQPAAILQYNTAALTTVAGLQAAPTGAAITTTERTVTARPVATGTGAAVASTTTAASRLDVIEADVREMKALLLKMSKGSTVPGGAVEKVAAPKEIKKSFLSLHCAACHDEKQANVKLDDGSLKGGGKVFFKDDVLLPMKASTWVAFNKQINSRKMPKGIQLTQEQGNGCLQELDAIKPED